MHLNTMKTSLRSISKVALTASMIAASALTGACGGSSATPAPAQSAAASPPPPPQQVSVAPAPLPPPGRYHEIATGSTLTRFQRARLLGHYSTENGASGFILDRTQRPFKAKLDGVDRVVPLEEYPAAFGSKEYRSSDHSIWLRIDESGDVVLFQGPLQHEGVNVVHDADAQPL